MDLVKFIAITTLCSVILVACGDSTSTEEPVKERTEAEVNQALKKLEISNTDSILQMGNEQLKSNPQSAVSFYGKVTSQLIKDKEYQKAGETFMAMAEIYKEKLNNPDSALINAEMALFMWESLEDSTNITKAKDFITEISPDETIK